MTPTKTRTIVIAGALLATFAFCVATALDVSDYADVYVRSRELPAEREFLTGISFQQQRSSQKRTVNNSLTFDSRHSLSLSFKALQHQFTASLHHNAELWHPKAVISVLDGEGDLIDTHSAQLVGNNAYLGEATIEHEDGGMKKRRQEKAFVSAVVVDYERGLFHMSIISSSEDGDNFVVEPTYLHHSGAEERRRRGEINHEEEELLLGENMVVYKENVLDLRSMVDAKRNDDEEAAEHCGNDVKLEAEDDGGDADFFDDVSPTGRCPPAEDTYLLVGVATDNQYTRQAGGVTGTRNTVSWIFNTMQGHFYRAVRNKPVLKSLVIHVSASSYSSSSSFNSRSCPSSIQSRLTPFCVWRARQRDSSIGLWHLLSGCLPDRQRIAGRAYYSSICQDNTRGCGISGYLGGNARWVVPTHEIGHNFGARPGSEIMSPYVNPSADGFSDDSIREMCYYTFRRYSRTHCLLSKLPDDHDVPDGGGEEDDDDSQGECECRDDNDNNLNKEDSGAQATVGSSVLIEAIF
ncbi:Sanke disintergrin [Balamuthia mandrillaris]